jgi:hypothetical protein
LVKNSLPKRPLAKSKANEKRFVSPLIGKTIGVPTKNYKKKLKKTGVETIPVRFCIFANPEVSVVIGKHMRYSVAMH